MALSIVIAGGGTGGHLYPGIAVARELLTRQPDARVSFAGTARGLEARVIPREVPRGSDRDIAESFQRRLRELVAELQARGFPRGRIVRELRRVAEMLERI